MRAFLLVAAFAATLAACGGGEGPVTDTGPAITAAPVATAASAATDASDRASAEICLYGCSAGLNQQVMNLTLGMGFSVNTIDGAVAYMGMEPSAYTGTPTTYAVQPDTPVVGVQAVYVVYGQSTNTPPSSAIVFIDNNAQTVQMNVYDSSSNLVQSTSTPFSQLVAPIGTTYPYRSIQMRKWKGCGYDC